MVASSSTRQPSFQCGLSGLLSFDCSRQRLVAARFPASPGAPLIITHDSLSSDEPPLVDPELRTGKPSTSRTGLQLTTLCPHSDHRMPLHTPTNFLNAFFFFCTVNTPEKTQTLSASGTYRQQVPSVFGYDHINCNPPVLIRTPKLTQFEPAQYWGGGPPGNSAVLYPFLPLYCLP